MKKTYLIALLLIIAAATCSGQPAHVFNLDKLSKNDALVTGWVFHAGDNAQWWQPGFNDSGWKAVDPDTDVTRFDALKKSGIGWIRVHIRLDSSFAGHMLAARISQYTASEIYVNGKLLARYGNISANPAEVKGYNTSKQPLIINLAPGRNNVIAVRLAYEGGLPYVSSLFEPMPVFSLSINNYQAAVINYIAYQDEIKTFVLVFALFGGMVLIVFFIYMVYFLFNRNKKVYLYYALFCLAICYITLPNEIFGVGRYGPIDTQMWVVFAEGTSFVAGMVFLLLTLYTMFGYRRRVVFACMSVIGLLSVVLMIYRGTTFFFVSTTFMPLIFMLEGVRVCLWAMKHQRKDAAYVLAGTVCFVLLVAVSGLLDQSTILAQLLWGAGIVCFPLGMAFYLGVQSSFTNKQLTATLEEVQTLSAKTLAQEQEKQQILANQNTLLEKQVTERTAELNRSLTELKQAQRQLVQSEKMASLGELTAGIAHEIQNPLNFVNNFSEVNREMLAELQQELDKGDIEEAKVIAANIAQNEAKINHHGKRADSIVKGMLEHSRASNGQKEPTDINKLTDEYLRLAYHGLRAKDKSFNAELITHFDESLPPVNVIPQDIGRVLLNLFNNAFYAVNQKTKTAGPTYKPTVEVSTSVTAGEMVISVRDNGKGIPENIKDKIMQPFFTTKPTGEGTGLGLSLSYDMVVKGHGGKIDISSTENIGSEFTIILPIE